MNVAGVKECCC